MKSIKHILAGFLLGLLLVIGVNASINVNKPVPQTWSVPNGTNAFGLNSSATPVITLMGTNYTGITTNFALTNGLSVYVKCGIVTAIQ